ncbi:ABC transporter permease [Streptomyces sp. NPDC049577]|uniref:ABC transporter permease n=1 Tax=Streptomyces sp. NPDC049577 TaxID=3155153 RepID=UPI0034223398
MGRYIARRLGQLVLVVLGATMILFACLFVLPGDPVGSVAGSDKARDPAVVKELRHRYGLDEPLVVQYGNYVGKLAQGDLGQDYTQGRPVTEILKPKIANTAKLAVLAIAFDVALGVVVGVIAALKRYSVTDVITTITTTIFIGVPPFVLGMLLQSVFAVRLGWVPVVADGSFKTMLLPALTLALLDAAIVSRLMRGSMLEIMRADYVKTAIAKGVPKRQVLTKHILRNSIIPVVTYIGISFGTLLGGALISEAIFNWDGIGLALVTAITQNNNPIVIGVVTISVGVFVVMNLIVDLLYAVLDPRIRLG